MDIISQMFNEHPFMFCVLAYILVATVVRIIKLPFRSFNIAVRGWPTGLLDADGDIVHPLKEETNNVT